MTIERVFHALGNPTRRAIVEKLSYGPISVFKPAEPLDNTLAAVMQHVKVLEKSGLVRTENVGRVRRCRMETQSLEVAKDWLIERRFKWERRLDRRGRFLAESEGN